MFLVSAFHVLVSYVIPFVFVLSIVVFVHEFGHFIVGRLCGVKVEVFSLGFGPKLIKYRDSKGTLWCLSAIPVGGFVKFFGDANSASAGDDEIVTHLSEHERKIAFPTQSVAKRAAIVAAGPIANFIFSLLIFTTLFAFQGLTIVEPRIGEIQSGEPAELAGFQVGDLIRSIDTTDISSWSDMQRIVQASAGIPLHFRVHRGDSDINITVTPREEEFKSRIGVSRFGLVGLRAITGPEAVRHVSLSPLDAFIEGNRKIYFIIDRTISYVAGVIAGREKSDQISGPVRIAQMSGVVAKVGFDALIELIAILSVSIGFMNLLPIPLLDGGHLIFYVFEAISGGPINKNIQKVGFGVGLAFVLSLMIFATYNDLSFLLSWK